MGRLRGAVIITCSALAIAACADVWGFHDLAGGDGGVGGDTSVDQAGPGSGSSGSGSSGGTDATPGDASGSSSGGDATGVDVWDATTGDSGGEAGVCTPTATQCSGNGVQTCGSNGQWGAAVACSDTCASGACSGTCTPGSTQCSGNSAVQMCVSGTWGTPTACTAQACVGGVCTGECSPGTTQCTSDTQVETCGSSGQWGETTCPDACLGTGVGSNCGGGTTLPAPTLVDSIGGIGGTVVTGGTYTNAPAVNIGNTTDFPNTVVFCYTTATNGGVAPACTPGTTPECYGSLQFTPSTTPGSGIPMNVTGTTLEVIACSTTQASPVAKETYTLSVAPVVVTDANASLTCGVAITIGQDCSVNGGVCSSATVLEGGPTATTPAVTICYSTTSTLFDCASGPGITCFNAGTNGLTQSTTTVSQGETISAISCLLGSVTQRFNSTVSTSPTLNYSCGG